MRTSEPATIPTALSAEGLLDALTNADLDSLQEAITARDVTPLIERLNAILTFANRQAQVRERSGTIGRKLGTGTGELIMHCVSYLDVNALAKVRVLSRQWRLWTAADELWLPLVVSRWPGVKALQMAGVVERDFQSLYFRRLRLEHTQPDAAIARPHVSDAEREVPTQKIFDKYALLVEMFCGDAEVLTGLFDFSFGSGRAGPFVVPIPQGRAQLPIDNLFQLRLSLTVLRRQDGKLMCACKNASAHDEGPDYLDFSLLLGGQGGTPFTPTVLPVEDDISYCIRMEGVRLPEEEDSFAISSFGAISVGLVFSGGIYSVWHTHRIWEELGEWV
eukprot:TRINITY_DN63213_c0_g1_i1.p1 TRINITY_DN63213_c0_g1~~TRINITY_DN63213_c0_g1_i1.p1  ORF type:complete len:369 (+),score=43.04 TRINITY_DN63213_c0_g1_i1:109-1107(+)